MATTRPERDAEDSASERWRAGRPAAGSVTSNVANGFEQPSTASDRASPVPRRIAPRTMCLMAARSCSAHAMAPSRGKVDGQRRYDPPGAGTTRASVRASQERPFTAQGRAAPVPSRTRGEGPPRVLIRGGTVIDPAQGLHATRDVRIADGRVGALGARLGRARGEEVVDARGLLVTPGLIDLHVHVFFGASHYGIEPDPHCLATGTTTVVDAGSAGALTFPAFRKYVIEVAATRILPFLNIGATGMLSAEVGELEELRFIDRTKALQSIEANRGLIRGVKVRLSRQQVGPNARVALLTARETAEAARLALMVHVGDTPIPLDDILIELRAGDVLTHCFHRPGEHTSELQ